MNPQDAQHYIYRPNLSSFLSFVRWFIFFYYQNKYLESFSHSLFIQKQIYSYYCVTVHDVSSRSITMVAVLPNNQLALVELNRGFVEERKSSAWDQLDRHFIHIQISLCHCWSWILYVATPDDEIIRETTAGAWRSCHAIGMHGLHDSWAEL